MRPPTVHATAFVRSRDGRSVLDGVGGTGVPGTTFTPDPDRVHAAVPALEELGLTVESVDGPTLALRGTPEAFTAAFGVPIGWVATATAPGYGAWRFTGTPDPDAVVVDPGSRLGGSLDAVSLDTPAVAAARVVETRRLFTGSPDPLTGQDLLLGEIGRTLDTGTPPWPAGRAAFPATDAATATVAGCAALQAWADDGLRAALHEHITRVRGAPVSAVLVESSAPPGIEAVLSGLGAARPAPLALDGAPPRRDHDGWARSAVERCAARYAHTVGPARDALVELVELCAADVAAVGNPAVAAAVTELRTTWADLRLAVERTATWIAELQSAAPHDADLLFSSESAALLRERLADVDAALAAADADDIGDAWGEFGSSVISMDRWFDLQTPRYEEAWQAAQQRMARHGAMVATALLAVTLDDVDVTLAQHVRPDVHFWGRPVPAGGRTVLSGSYGLADAAITAAAVRTRQGVSALRLRERARAAQTLHVLAAGNATEPGDPTPDAPNLEAVAAANADNVLVVGGCGPDAAGRWLGVERTHGYGITVPPAEGATVAHRVRIPHVCATTMGVTGGAVAFPDTEPAQGWWTGSGSSLSTPIVAAVCALVWSAFPDLSAGQVVGAVLAGAPELDGPEPGAAGFHIPTVGGDGISGGSNLVADVGRVSLPGALIAAMQASTDVLRTPLTALLDERVAATGVLP
ncbi:S8 family serine peptidase [Pseudonocardia sp.]|uniref:S8 family serine peptidase n=1 Tax=Pseudonocardia sp. TaxID=60912 RepID=UPI0026173CBD|nr:S8 family serine peptidase [Pseudonocardia sp.]